MQCNTILDTNVMLSGFYVSCECKDDSYASIFVIAGVRARHGEDVAQHVLHVLVVRGRVHGGERLPRPQGKVGKNESVDWDFLSRQSSQSTGVDSLL